MTSKVGVLPSPRVLLLPEDAKRSSAADCAELAAACGLILDPWQLAVLEGAMSERDDNSWAAALVALICSRQNGKNVILEARELYGLLVLHERIIHTAHQFKTTLEDWERLLAWIEDGPLADELTGKHATPAQGYVMRFRGGGKINFIARSRMSGRGLSGDLLVFNEAQDLDNKAQGALLPTISARPGSQSWYLGSAPGVHSEVFQRLRARGRSGDDGRLAYFEYSADPDCDPSDEEAWRQANPAYPVRITNERIEAEFLESDIEEFKIERLSISPEMDAAVGKVIPHAAWGACLADKSGPVGPVMFGLDVADDRSWAAFAVAASSGLGGVHVEITGDGTHLDYRPGTDWIVARAKELIGQWGGRLAVAAGSPAASLLVELEASGLAVVEVSTQDHARACGAFFDSVMQRTLRHLGQPALNVAVAAGDKRFVGDAWVWSRRGSKTDISPLVAVTLAKWAHDQHEPAMAGPGALIL